MENQKELTASLSLIYLYIKRKNMRKNKSRRWWVRPLYQKRDYEGFYTLTFKFIKKEDPEQFFKCTRMRTEDFDYLVNLLKDDLTKTSFRKAIARECRIALTVVYLAHGVAINYLAWSFRMGRSTVREIILEVCDVIWKNCAFVYLPQCQKTDWQFIANEFYTKWQMPNSVGSIDGKHIQIQCPSKSGSLYYNYKGYSSIVLLAVCDADYIFTAVDVGAVGSQSDGGILQQSAFGKALLNNDLNLPDPTYLPNSSLKFPYFFIGDNAFPLRKDLMRPFPNSHTSDLIDVDKTIFNYRLSRARRVIENAFGIISARWRVLLKMIEFSSKNTEKIVLACTILHNFIKTHQKLYTGNYNYCPEGFVDSDDERNGRWRDEINGNSIISVAPSSANNASRLAFGQRDKLKLYFMNEGKTSFQNNYMYR